MAYWAVVAQLGIGASILCWANSWTSNPSWQVSSSRLIACPSASVIWQSCWVKPIHIFFDLAIKRFTDAFYSRWCLSMVFPNFCLNLADSLDWNNLSSRICVDARLQIHSSTSVIVRFDLLIISNALVDSLQASDIALSIILLEAWRSQKMSCISWLLRASSLAIFFWSRWHIAWCCLHFFVLASRLALKVLWSLLTFDRGPLALAGPVTVRTVQASP